MHKQWHLSLCFLALVFPLCIFTAYGAASNSHNIILSTTTSTQDSGLLDVLVPLFEKQTGYSVKTVSVGTGQALALAAKGDADVVLVHAPDLEKKYVAEGKLLNRRLVMYNEFVIIGPKDDRAKVRSIKSAASALKAIAQAKVNFVSRGDNSGTHVLEKSLWKAAGIEPKGKPIAVARSQAGHERCQSCFDIHSEPLISSIFSSRRLA